MEYSQVFCAQTVPTTVGKRWRTDAIAFIKTCRFSGVLVDSREFDLGVTVGSDPTASATEMLFGVLFVSDFWGKNRHFLRVHRESPNPDGLRGFLHGAGARLTHNVREYDAVGPLETAVARSACLGN